MTDYAALLHATIERCPNGCSGELVPSERVDGLHLTCRACGFYATEEHVRRLEEKIQPAPNPWARPMEEWGIEDVERAIDIETKKGMSNGQ